MVDGYIKVAAATPIIKVADCEYNTENIIKIIDESACENIKLLVFPELCITGYTCGDLFLQDILLDSAKTQLLKIKEHLKELDIIVLVGLPMMKNGNLYNVAAVLKGGNILGIIPKHNIPNYSEFYEARHFSVGNELVEYITIDKEQVPFGTNIIFKCNEMEQFKLSVEICEDVWVPCPPSTKHALAGATIIANLSASNESTGKDNYRRELVKGQSSKLVCGYIYADAGEGESSTDLVYSAHNIILENGTVLKESNRFKNEKAVSELDLGKIASERRRITTFVSGNPREYEVVTFSFHDRSKTQLTRFVDKAPFIPKNQQDREKRCNEITMIQAMGLKKRLVHTNCKTVVIGISGGLDSTLALLVAKKTFELAGLNMKDIICVTMPCFGTTDRTYQNAIILMKQIGATLIEIPIKASVTLHFKDIGHDINTHDVTFENGQARERTQILMDIANKYNGMVVGTGDMSELALGWATYNGDHMSMYGVNASVPKTLVRYLVLYFAQTSEDEKLRAVLMDVLDTPVSPELLPPKDGEIAQKTEDLVGPYELHDFYLYYMIRFGFYPSKIYRIANYAFEGEYDGDTILKWLKVFYRRFFAQQFKRSCLPDGPKVGSVALSPRGDLRMPSDATVSLWLQDLEDLN